MIRRLKYKKIFYRDLELNFARNYCRTIHITVKPDGNIYYVVPYGTDDLTIDRFLDEKYNWIVKSVEKFKIKNDSDNADNYKNTFENREVTKYEKKELEYKIYNYIKKYEPLLSVKVEKFSLRKMKTLWGSCSYQKRTIRFNTKLYFKSDEFVEYIVLHEMCHILVPNHSQKFYSIVARYMPNYKSIKKNSINN